MTTTVSQNVKSVGELVRRNPKGSLRKLAKPTEISKSSMSRTVSEKLGLKPYRCQKTNILLPHRMENHLIKCQILIQRFNLARYRDVIFSNEKFFCYRSSAEPPKLLCACQISFRSQQTGKDPLTLWTSGIGHDLTSFAHAGKSPLFFFFEKGVKMDSKIYLEGVLGKILILWSKLILDSKQLVFQQDSAPALNSRIVLEWCRDKLPDFMCAEEWPPYSPDLNPMD